jgi:methionyl-tRNA synthetase
MELGQALEHIWKIISEDNKYIGENKPWELMKTDEKKFGTVMEKLLKDLYEISELLVPFIPETSEKIKKALETKEVEPLFGRIRLNS